MHGMIPRSSERSKAPLPLRFVLLIVLMCCFLSARSRKTATALAHFGQTTRGSARARRHRRHRTSFIYVRTYCLSSTRSRTKHTNTHTHTLRAYACLRYFLQRHFAVQERSTYIIRFFFLGCFLCVCVCGCVVSGLFVFGVRLRDDIVCERKASI